MGTLHSRYTKMLLLVCTLLFLSACVNGETPVDPAPDNDDVEPISVVESYLDPEQQAQNLFVKGAVQSGIVADLNNYSPFIIFSMKDDAFRSYLKRQGVSESEFLASPNLRAFYEAHVIGDASGLIDQVYESETAVDAETLSGGTVTLESRDDESGNAEIFIEGRKTGGAFVDYKNNYDWLLLNRPIIDFPVE